MSMSEVEVGVREDGETLPLIVRPKQGRDSVEFLQTWISRNKSWIEQKLLEHGRRWSREARLLRTQYYLRNSLASRD